MTFRHRIAAANVEPIAYRFQSDGGRAGTVFALEDDLVDALGEPHRPDTCDGKVTKIWAFKTPRGECVVRDYWWNRSGEWSIGAKDRRTVRWVTRYLESRLGYAVKDTRAATA